MGHGEKRLPMFQDGLRNHVTWDMGWLVLTCDLWLVTCDLWVPSPDGWPLQWNSSRNSSSWPNDVYLIYLINLAQGCSRMLKDAQGCSRHSLGWFSNVAIDLFSDVLISLINLAAWITLCKQCLGDPIKTRSSSRSWSKSALSIFCTFFSTATATSVLIWAVAAQNLSLLQTSSCEPTDQSNKAAWGLARPHQSVR